MFYKFRARGWVQRAGTLPSVSYSLAPTHNAGFLHKVSLMMVVVAGQEWGGGGGAGGRGAGLGSHYKCLVQNPGKN